MESKRVSPYTPEQIDRLKEVEQRRKAIDPSYITAAEVGEMPEELRDDPRVRARIEHSRPNWPEEQMPISQAVPATETGAGETVEDRSVDGAALLGSLPSGKMGD